jgi:hypothetical protein
MDDLLKENLRLACWDLIEVEGFIEGGSQRERENLKKRAGDWGKGGGIKRPKIETNDSWG